MHQKALYHSFFILLAIPYCLQAQTDCDPWLAKVISVGGKVDSQQVANYNWHPIKRGDTFCYGDKIRTANHSRATLLFENGTRVTIKQNSTLNFSAKKENESSWILNLIQGSSFFRSRQPQRLNIQTPFINAVHQGTEFLVSVNSHQTEITVFDGQVAATNQQGEILINKGYTGIASKNQPPRTQALTIRPEDAVQWTLYYPPIINYQNISSSKDQALQPSINAHLQGKPVQALELLDKIPSSQHNASYLTLKASLLLMTGSVDETLNLIDQALVLEPENSTAIALQSIIAVTKNRQNKALTLAQKAVSLAPESATAKIALSYAHQSNFEIEPALNATQEAVRLSPDNALAWARLSELQLSTGKRKEALVSAQKAQTLNPQLARTQTILGFTYLAQIDIDQAKSAFKQAINLDSADPLAHLGLGLAKIRKGSITDGSHDLETAVSLDPDNAIMRSYLGKAYYELRNDGYAETELKIAKEMDPNDPTPWFYDAIRKQTTNRPVEALHDMQKAIELNDNRGVYRSKLLLDEDLAARNAAIGKIYNNLGFEQLGLQEGWNSLNTNPNNYSAHRLLADNYASLPRHEIARVSELLQSQLLQPINLNPVQPQLAKTNLLFLSDLGPESLSFNEFNPLFTRNQFVLQSSGIVGSNDTFGEEVVHAGLWNELSYSLGQFHYETDGFRTNNNLKTDLYNIFIQAKILPNTNIQFEFRRENTESGDLRQLFDSSLLLKNRRQTLDSDSFRFGFNIDINSNSNIIGFVTYGELDKAFNDLDFLSFQDFGIPLSSGLNLLSEPKDKFKNWNSEIQFIGHWDRFNLIAGAGHVNQHKVRSFSLKTRFSNPSDLGGPFGFLIQNFPNIFNQSIKEVSIENHAIGYIYSTTEVLKDFDLTLGLSFDYINRDSSDGKQLKFTRKYINPKLGLLWDLSDSTTLRAAWFKTVKRAFVSNQTIEPTYVSGFTQFFDDPDSARATRYGFGIDQQITPKLKIGGEVSWRDMTAPVPFIGSSPEILFISQKEESHRAYLYWTPIKTISLGAEYFFQTFDRTDSPDNSLSSGIPVEMKTHKVPLTLTYNNPNGLFGNIVGSFIDQSIILSNGSGIGFSGHDSFWIADASIGYRLPKRWGIINLKVNNIFGQKFNFQEENFNIVSSIEGNVVQPKLVPERIFSAQITLSF
jgi:Flp pilus assembly protein TadD